MPRLKVVPKRSKGAKRYDRHQEGTVPMTSWVDEDWKEELKKEATIAAEYLGEWSLSDHIRFIIDDYRGKWNKKYRPIQYASNAHKRD